MLQRFCFLAMLSFLCIAAAAAVVAYLYRMTVTELLLEEQGEQAAALTRVLSGSLWPQLEPLLVPYAGESPQGPSGRLAAHTIGEALRRVSGELQVIKLRVYDASAHTVYSTDASEIGQVKTGDPGFLLARNGKTSIGMLPVEQIAERAKTVADRDVFRTHIPVRAPSTAPILGVFETQLDMAPMRSRVRARENIVLAGVLITFSLLYAGLLIVGLYTRRVVQNQEAEHAFVRQQLQGAHDSLEATVKERTLELEKANANLEAEIGERRRNYEMIRELAYFDSLTRLPNRAFIKMELERSLAAAKRNHTCVATMIVDLDQFKRINDTFGHARGDELLRQAASRLTACIRVGDSLEVNSDATANRVARLGGDEFTLVIHDLGDRLNVSRVANRVIEAFREPFVLDIYKVQVSPSIGIAYHPFDGESADTLLKNADTAMYQAKQRGRNNYQFYSRSMSTVVYEKLALENKLRRALEQDEFVLHYQPKVDARSGCVVGVEALLRWNSPDGGLIPPSKIIPLADETGLIVEIGEWVLNEACRQCKEWHNLGYAELAVAVNISSPHFRQERLITAVNHALRQSGLPPRFLEVEVTESMLMDDVESASKTLGYLKTIGVKVSIDDFGTGYSSLNYLKTLPVDGLKIDRSFVKDLSSSAGDAAITNAIIVMAQILGLSVVAEGVETPQQRELLLAQGCHEMQGFFFSVPVTADELTIAFNRPLTNVIPGNFGYAANAGA